MNTIRHDVADKTRARETMNSEKKEAEFDGARER